MPLVEINSVGVISGSIMMPKVGVWSADLVIDQPDGTGFGDGTQVTISADGGLELKGVVAPGRTGDFLDAVHVRVLGGAGGMGKTASAQGYVQPGAYIRDVINGLTKDSGETLSSTVDSGFLGTNLTAWSTVANTIAWNLRALLKMNAPTFSWRILPDGTLWMGEETWDAASGTFDMIEQSPADGTFMIGCESPSLLPGISLADVGNINRVEHQISKDRIRSLVSVELPEGDRGIQGAITRMVAQATAGVDYFGLYECKVVSQSADLSTVDVSPLPPVDKRFPGLQRVEVRAGTGIKVQFSGGAKVLLGWKGGDPSKPYVLPGLSTDSVQAIQLAGTTPVARQGDGCDGGTLVFFPGTGAATLSYIPPGGVVPPATPPTINIPLSPKINQGSSIVGCG